MASTPNLLQAAEIVRFLCYRPAKIIDKCKDGRNNIEPLEVILAGDSEEGHSALELTRKLIASIINRSRYTLIGNAPLDGGGIDFVLKATDGNIIAIVAVEISHSGDAQLQLHPLYGMQLSDRWISACIEVQPQKSLVRIALQNAIANSTLIKAIGGVAKPSGDVVLTPVSVA